MFNFIIAKALGQDRPTDPLSVGLIKFSAKLAPEINPSSGYGKMIKAMGQVTGGLVPDGSSFKFDLSDFSMSSAQLLISEAGIDQHVVAIGQSSEAACSFFVLSSGLIMKVISVANGGSIDTYLEPAVPADMESCNECIAMREAIKTIAQESLVNAGKAAENDTFVGFTNIDATSALMRKPVGNGMFIVFDDANNGAVKGGWYFSINATTRNPSNDESMNMMVWQEMTKAQLADERKKYSEAIMSQGNAFPQKVGVA